MFRRICIHGGPGSGKSTIGPDIFSFLKKSHYDVEFVSEYIKGWAYEGKKPISFDPIKILSKQLEREDHFLRYVNLVVAECPLLLSYVYAKDHVCRDEIRSIAMKFESCFPSFNIFLDRKNIPYNPKGRYQSYDQAIEIDNIIQDTLKENDLSFCVVDPTDLNSIFEVLLKNVSR